MKQVKGKEAVGTAYNNVPSRPNYSRHFADKFESVIEMRAPNFITVSNDAYMRKHAVTEGNVDRFRFER